MPRRPDPNNLTAPVPLREKLDFLRRADAYPGSVRAVEPVETHMSWVFLTDAHAYKMKKPVRYPFLDYGTLERRRRMCGEEVRLNRRLAPWVYLGLAVLVRDGRGRLALSDADPPPAGDPVEWLVKMVRLPAARLLDGAIQRDLVSEADAARTAAHLAAFYAGAEPVVVPAPIYSRRLAEAVDRNARAVAEAGIPNRRIAGIVRALHRFLDRRAAILDTRSAGHLVEGHGDLRPEHVFVGEPPAIIDCLEFDRALRLVDPLDELGFLTMECARLGAPKWGELFLEIYLRRTDDHAPEDLLAFHMAGRAMLRAALTLGHLRDGEAVAEPRRWYDKADEYLDLADGYTARL